MTWLLLLGIPVLVVLVIALIGLGPSSTRPGRYDPSGEWIAAPLWVGLDTPPTPATNPTGGEFPHGGVSATW